MSDQPVSIRTVHTIKELFAFLCKNKKKIIVPNYQRAYSWEKVQWEDFFEDMRKQEINNYYLGQFILEGKDEKGEYCIIDGQQRLTTVLLFWSAMVKVMESKKEGDDIKDKYLKEGVFETVEGDDTKAFKDVMEGDIKNKGEKGDTLSSKRIRDGFRFFNGKLKDLKKKEGEKAINDLQTVLENAIIGIFLIPNQSLATRAFLLENDRGKPISKFEILKAVLIHHIYLAGGDNEEMDKEVKSLQESIADINKHLDNANVLFSETDLLRDYYYLYLVSINYNEVKSDGKKEGDWSKDIIKDYTAFLLENYENDSEGKIKWIKDFFEGFKQFTQSAQEITDTYLNKDTESANKLRNLLLLFKASSKYDWRIALLALFNHKERDINDNLKAEKREKLYEKILKLLEVLYIKMKLSGSSVRKDGLPDYIEEYAYEDEEKEDEEGYENEYEEEEYEGESKLEELYDKIKTAVDNGFTDKCNWCDVDVLEEYLYSIKDHYFSCPVDVIKYVLWQYEDHLRSKKGEKSLFQWSKKDKKNIQSIYNTAELEHIAPLSPDGEGYREKFEDNYLNSVGNLGLLEKTLNSSANNKFPKKKRETAYEKTQFLMYEEINAAIDNQRHNRWTQIAIEKRHKHIIDFAREYLSLPEEEEA